MAARIPVPLFDKAEELDWIGPLEVGSVWEQGWPDNGVEVFTYLESDVWRVRRAGLITILVLTGTTAQQDLEPVVRPPDVVMPRPADILAMAPR